MQLRCTCLTCLKWDSVIWLRPACISTLWMAAGLSIESTCIYNAAYCICTCSCSSVHWFVSLSSKLNALWCTPRFDMDIVFTLLCNHLASITKFKYDMNGEKWNRVDHAVGYSWTPNEEIKSNHSCHSGTYMVLTIHFWKLLSAFISITFLHVFYGNTALFCICFHGNTALLSPKSYLWKLLLK